MTNSKPSFESSVTKGHHCCCTKAAASISGNLLHCCQLLAPIRRRGNSMLWRCFGVDLFHSSFGIGLFQHLGLFVRRLGVRLLLVHPRRASTRLRCRSCARPLRRCSLCCFRRLVVDSPQLGAVLFLRQRAVDLERMQVSSSCRTDSRARRMSEKKYLHKAHVSAVAATHTAICTLSHTLLEPRGALNVLQCALQVPGMPGQTRSCFIARATRQRSLEQAHDHVDVFRVQHRAVRQTCLHPYLMSRHGSRSSHGRFPARRGLSQPRIFKFTVRSSR